MSAVDPLEPALAAGRPRADIEQDRAMSAVIARLFGPSSAPAPRLGRYRLGARLGAGSHGVVYAAHDPKLDRDVALKLLRPGRPGPGRAAAISRLVREGQALAQLSHPNVVGIYDMGRVPDGDPAGEGVCFLVMERVDGEDLYRWLKLKARSSRQILEVFLRAGRGLAAAHRIGLVHRDFKPENILVGTDGHVKVADLGLVRWGLADTSARSDRPTPRDPPSTPASRRSSSALTRTGAVLGTPRYMAPEQHRGEPADARSDQYAFCVSLFEALVGRPPFDAPTLTDLVTAKQHPPPVPTPPVPRPLARALARGLQPDPEQRYPTMDALLHDLSRPRRRRVLAVGGLIIGLTAGSIVSAGAIFERPDPTAEACDREARAFAAQWDDARALRVGAAFERAGHRDGSALVARLQPWLDAHRQAWEAVHDRACGAAPLGPAKPRSSPDPHRRRACLGHLATELDALLQTFEHADREQLQRAISAVASLTPPSRCEVSDGLEPPPARLDADIQRQRDRLAQARALQRAGRWDEAVELVSRVARSPSAQAYAPLQAEAWLRWGAIDDNRGQYEDSEDRLTRAHALATSVGHDRVAAKAAQLLIMVVGVRRTRLSDAQAWARHAAAASARAGLDQRARATQLYSLAGAENVGGERSAAIDHYRRALALFEQALGPEHPNVMKTRGALAFALASIGELEAAARHYDLAIEQMEATLGPEHLSTARARSNRGSLARTRGQWDRARDDTRAALEAFRQWLPHDHPSVSAALNQLGLVAYDQEQYEQAQAWYEQAYALRRERAQTSPRSLGHSLMNLGSVALSRRDFDRARQYFVRARERIEEGLGPDHVELSYPELGLGVALHELGHPADALAVLERALLLRRTNPIPEVRVAEAEIRVAWVLMTAYPDQRPRALELARHAHRVYAEKGAGFDGPRHDIEVWLADQGEPVTSGPPPR